jgi:hypothetical protein
MDVAAAGFAASQIASIQRGQQAALSGIRAQNQQDQTVTNLLTQAVSAAKQGNASAPSAPQPAPSSGGGGSSASGAATSPGAPNPGARRGSLVNILA